MSATEAEQGTCEVCGSACDGLVRTYFHYDIKCDCHSPMHFEFVRHCPGCVAKAPEKTSVLVAPLTRTKL